MNEKTTEPQDATRAPVKTGRVKNILMLDDETELTEQLAPFFEQNGYKLVSVTNGVDGLKQIMARDFSAIICDMMMPNLPGDMFYRAVERVKPQLCQRFIFITGYKGNQEIEEFLRRVGGLVLWKPFETLELMNALKMILQKAGD